MSKLFVSPNLKFGHSNMSGFKIGSDLGLLNRVQLSELINKFGSRYIWITKLSKLSFELDKIYNCRSCWHSSKCTLPKIIKFPIVLSHWKITVANLPLFLLHYISHCFSIVLIIVANFSLNSHCLIYKLLCIFLKKYYFLLTFY